MIQKLSFPSSPAALQSQTISRHARQPGFSSEIALGRHAFSNFGDQVLFSGHARQKDAGTSAAGPSDNVAEARSSNASIKATETSSSILVAKSKSSPGSSRSASPPLMPPSDQPLPPRLTVSCEHPELPVVPQLKARDIAIHVDSYYDKVPLWEGTKLVSYKDLKRADLLPKSATTIPGLQKPIMRSRFVSLDRDRMGCLLYVPDEKGFYVPRTVYQSSSHAAWQAPDYIERGWRTTDKWRVGFFGKGPKSRSKMLTALQPELQRWLAEASPESARSLEQKNGLELFFARNVLIGVTSNVLGDGSVSVKDDSDQAQVHTVVKLEDLYPGSRVDAEKPGFFSGKKVTPVPPRKFNLPDPAWPDFSRTSQTYLAENNLYGPIRAEVFPSRDGKLWWTYYVQTDTNRAWVANVHRKDSPTVDTGLPKQLVDVGRTTTLAPYEYRGYLTGTRWVKRLDGTPYVDIWKKYTSRLPLVQAYYRARWRPCPD